MELVNWEVEWEKASDMINILKAKKIAQTARIVWSSAIACDGGCWCKRSLHGQDSSNLLLSLLLLHSITHFIPNEKLTKTLFESRLFAFVRSIQWDYLFFVCRSVMFCYCFYGNERILLVFFIEYENYSNELTKYKAFLSIASFDSRLWYLVAIIYVGASVYFPCVLYNNFPFVSKM